MTRSLVLLAISVLALLAALLLPAPQPAVKGPDPAPLVMPPAMGTLALGPVSKAGSLTLRAATNRTLASKDGDEVSVVLDVTAGGSGSAERPAADVVLVLDRSRESDAASALVTAVRRVSGDSEPPDRIALIDSRAPSPVLVRLHEMNVEGLAATMHAMNNLPASGKPDLRGALSAARHLLTRNGQPDNVLRRIILVTDNPPRKGLQGWDFVGLARELNADRITLSVLGLGYEVDEALLGRVADIGGGEYRHASSSTIVELLRTFAASNHPVVASAVDLVLKPAPGVEIVEVPGVPAPSGGGTWHMWLNDMSAWQTRHVTAVVRFHGSTETRRRLLEASLTYKDGCRGGQPAHEEVAPAIDLTDDVKRAEWSYDRPTAWVSVNARWTDGMIDVDRLRREGKEDSAGARLQQLRTALKGDLDGVGGTFNSLENGGLAVRDGTPGVQLSSWHPYSVATW
jgi:Mg-chelatase subunit ChlD